MQLENQVVLVIESQKLTSLKKVEVYFVEGSH
jgi:hypothetical protein